jgi:hypothetical protein
VTVGIAASDQKPIRVKSDHQFEREPGTYTVYVRRPDEATTRFAVAVRGRE